MEAVVVKFFVILTFGMFMGQEIQAQPKSKTSTAYSYSSSKSSSSGKSSRSSISSSENDEFITVNARFDKGKTDKIKKIIEEAFGENTNSKGRRMIWDEVLEGLELSLSKGSLRIFYEKDGDEDDEFEVRDLVEEISSYIQG